MHCPFFDTKKRDRIHSVILSVAEIIVENGITEGNDICVILYGAGNCPSFLCDINMLWCKSNV